MDLSDAAHACFDRWRTSRSDARSSVSAACLYSVNFGCCSAAKRPSRRARRTLRARKREVTRTADRAEPTPGETLLARRHTLRDSIIQKSLAERHTTIALGGDQIAPCRHPGSQIRALSQRPLMPGNKFVMQHADAGLARGLQRGREWDRLRFRQLNILAARLRGPRHAQRLGDQRIGQGPLSRKRAANTSSCANANRLSSQRRSARSSSSICWMASRKGFRSSWGPRFLQARERA